MSHFSKALVLLAAFAGCSTAAMEDPESGSAAAPGVDAGEATSVGCRVEILYPRSRTEAAVDELFYDSMGRLLQRRRLFADGVESVHEWTWSEDGGEAYSEWFDGARRTVFDKDGRPVQGTSYDKDGNEEWVEEIRYHGDGPVASRLLHNVATDTPWMQTTFEWTDDLVGEARTVNLVEPSDSRLVRYHVAPEGENLKLVESFDIDDDGLIDFKTARLFDLAGVVLRGVDSQGRLIDYDYEGDHCAAASAKWILGDPYFVDM